jgi:hypothetical protein
MVRKILASVLVVGLLLIGYQPTAAASVVMAAKICCEDCDMPAIPDGQSECGRIAGCMVGQPLSILPSASDSVRFPLRLVQAFADQTAAALSDSAPPFRPPRSSFLA